MYVWTMPMDSLTGRPAGLPHRISVRSGRGPVFSPDDRTVAYTVIPPSDTVAPRIAAIPSSGGAETVLVRQSGWAQQLRWSPDGRWIYYRARLLPGPGGVALVRVLAHGGEPEVLLQVRDFLGISSDGRFLAYIPGHAVAGPDRMVIGISTAEGVEVGRFTMPRAMVARNWASSGLKLLAQRNHPTSAIHQVSVRGGAVRALTASVGEVYASAWSPDGRRIAVPARAGDRFHLTLVEAGGGVPRRIPSRAEPDGAAPVWSPDGRFIAFFSATAMDRSLHVVEVPTGREIALSAVDSVEALAWRRDSRALLYLRTRAGTQELRETVIGGDDALLRTLPGELAGGRSNFVGDSLLVVGSRAGLFTVSTRTSDHRKLYEPEDHEVGGNWYSFGGNVSRDGRWAAVPVASRTGDSPSRQAIRLIPLDGGTGRVVPVGPVSYVGPFFWHPDGQHLVVMGTVHHEQRIEAMLVPLNGEPVRALTAADASLELWAPRISPDGTSIAYSALTGLSSSLWEIDLTAALAPLAGQAGR